MKRTSIIKNLFGILFIGLVILSNLTAQQGFTYQAVARNLSGSPMIDQALTVKMEIRTDNQDGNLVWGEEHSVVTSPLGLFSLMVGDPSATNKTGSAGSFDQIDWSAASYCLRVWIKTDGDFMDMGGAPIQTVPIAQFANSAKGATGNFIVQPNLDPQPEEALFEVKRSDGQPVFAVYEDMVWVYTDPEESKGVKGGFAVGGYNRTKGVTQEFMRVTADSVRVYIDAEPDTKGVKGGFAVGGYNRTGKGVNDDLFFNLSPRGNVEKLIDKSQILFYPLKDAFLAGTVHIGSPDSVGQNSTALGYKPIAMGQFSQAFGYKSMALGNDSYALGSGATASGDKSFAFGSVGIDTSGNPTGIPTTASGNYAIAFGMGANAKASGAMSLGTNSIAEGYNSVAIGYGTTTSPDSRYATAIGYRSKADGEKSIAIGAHYSYTLYIPTFPIRFPFTKPRYITRYNEAVGKYSISFGNGNYSKDGGLAVGTYNFAYDQGTVAIGVSNSARKKYAFSAGYNNDAVGYYSMAIGNNLGSQSTHSMAIGTYNEIIGDTADWIPTDPLFQIGNGTSSTRHDAFRVDKNGKVHMNITNSSYGLHIRSNIEPEHSGTYTWALLSEVIRTKDASTYYSGVFRDQGTLGDYFGLFADERSGAGFDVAEYYFDTYSNTEAGDVLVADPMKDESVIKSNEPYQTSVLGVVSTDPHMVMGMDLVVDEETGESIEGVSATRLALTGRVPVKITEENGPVEPGDLLTTSSTPGHAMKWTLLDVSQAKDFEELKSMLAENERRRNAIIGKSVGSSGTGTGTVMVLISLQ